MKNRFDDIVKRVNDDFVEFDSFLNPFRVRTYTFNGQVIDMDKYDVILKPTYLDQEIKRVEQELETLQRQQESTIKYYENRKIALLEEKEKYKRQKANSG
jgi:hypothetical protein